MVVFLPNFLQLILTSLQYTAYIYTPHCFLLNNTCEALKPIVPVLGYTQFLDEMILFYQDALREIGFTVHYYKHSSENGHYRV